MMTKKTFPKVMSLGKMLGPSFLVLAMGLGSGEIILWPYLVSQYGLGIAWGALVGITMQFFINMEIERYALIKGESVFVGLYRKIKGVSWWFIISTFIGFGLPGIIAASAKMIAYVLGLTEYKYLAILFLLLMGLVLTINSSVYKTMEIFTKTTILLFVPLIFVLVVFIASPFDWHALWHGLGGFGEGYRFLPEGISIATFLAAFAYSGAGGNLNLTQSVYIKEKGYGMGKYSQKLSGLLRESGKTKVMIEGEDFETNEDSIKNFKNWWRAINLEHLLIFWGVGLLSMLFLMVLSYATTFGKTNSDGISFVVDQSTKIATIYGMWSGSLVLLILGVLLFQTQLGILDSTSRIMGENWALIQGVLNAEEVNLSRIYATFVWSQILFGILLFLFDFKEPRMLIVLGAVINALAMLVHVVLVRYLNEKSFKGVFATSRWRKIILWVIIAFFAGFSGYNLYASVFWR